MCKNIVTLTMLVLSPYLLNAQYRCPNSTSIENYEVLDSADFECTYELHYLKNIKNENAISKDIKVLLIGQKISKFYSYYSLVYDSLCQQLIKKGHTSVPSNSNSGTQGYEIFKDIGTKQITYTDKGTCLRGNFIYEDNIDMQWNICPEKSIILDHQCQKATTKFRGRDYEVWFADNIPLSNGPWKFGGLPGLILKVRDLQNNFVFECTGIRSLKKKLPILFYKIDYTKIKREDLAKLYGKYHDDPTGYLESIGEQLLFMGKDGKARVNRQAKYPYNPIELE
ncbi:MAG: GLPGLI family protein [Bacteroidales bacterium]|jgi:GLPGLI family protein|nr:GLPGLI family protein [Bacteroidales bacterium]